MQRLTTSGTAATGLAILTAHATAFDVIENKQAWEDAVGDVTKLDFVFRVPQFLDDQYLDLGVYFPDGDDLAETAACFHNDGWGATGAPVAGPIHVAFIEPQNWIAVEFCGVIQFHVLYQGVEIYESPILNGEPGEGLHFDGLVSFDQPFDEVVIPDPADGSVYVDDLFFGALDPHQPDLNSDGQVNGVDLGILLAAWGTTGPGDLNEDGQVDGMDLGLLLADWTI
jgi:hypothetical protein